MNYFISRFRNGSLEMEQTTAQYLLNHEEDIAIGLDDFGDLRIVFRTLFGRDPEQPNVSKGHD